MSSAVLRSFLSTLLLTLPSATAAPPERGPMPHLVDLYGDPLPEGAIARLGSIRLRHANLSDFTILPDGTTAVTVGGDECVRWWDLATGRPMKVLQLPPELHSHKLALSPDATAVASANDKEAVIGELPSGRVLQTIPVADYVDCLTFSPDGMTLAVGVDGYELALVDRRTGRVRQARLSDKPERGHRDFLRVSFARNSKRLVVTGMHWKQARSAVFDVADAREVFSVPGRTSAAALSPDGMRLTVGENPPEDEARPAVLRGFDLKTGKETFARPDVIDRAHFSVEFTPDGKAVLALGPTRAGLFDPVTGELVRRLPTGPEGWLSPDGRLVVQRSFRRLRAWDLATGRELNDRPGDFGAPVGAASLDGRVLAVESVGDDRVDLWDAATGQRIRGLPSPDDNSYNLRLAFAPDGRRLAATRSLGVTWAWDVRTGRATRPTPVGLRDEPWGPYHEYVPSPDGRLIAAMIAPGDRREEPKRLEVWDAGTGRLVHRHAIGLADAYDISGWLPDGTGVMVRVEKAARLIDPHTGRLGPSIPVDETFTVGSDSRVGSDWWNGHNSGGDARVWDLATGRQIVGVRTGESVHQAVGVAAAARALVVADGRWLRVVDVATGHDRGRWALPDLGPGYWGDHPVERVTILPGDRRVVTPLRDGTALVWDLSAFPPPRLTNKHGEPELRSWWDDLAGEDAARAYAAGWKMAEAPAADLIAFVRPRLRPANAPDPDEVRKRIADLDSPTFATREAAARNLHQMGPAVLPHLYQRPAGLSAEAVERLRKLDEQLSTPVPPADTLRALRAIAVLERVRTIDAHKLLDDLARGASSAPETKAAVAALKRFQRQGWMRP